MSAEPRIDHGPTSGPYELCGHFIVGLNGEQIATVNNYYSGARDVRNVANGHLLKASFSLHAALKGILRWSIDTATPIPDEVFRPLIEALAKAEGRT